jgi:hypothetical protein
MTPCIDFPQTRAAMAAFELAFTATQALGREPSRDRLAEWLSWRQTHNAAETARAVVVAAYAEEMLPVILGGRWRKTTHEIWGSSGVYYRSRAYKAGSCHDLFDHALHFRQVGVKGRTTWKNAVLLGRPYNLEAGDLVIAFSDGATKNLGRVVGQDAPPAPAPSALTFERDADGRITKSVLR